MPGIGKWRSQRRKSCWFALIGLAFAYRATSVYAVDATICRYVSSLPDDCGSAGTRKYDNLHHYRYLEIDLFAKDVLKSQLYESVYNTTGLNGGDESRDSAPQSLVQALNAKAIAFRFDQSSLLLDDRLARRPGLQRGTFWRIERGLDGQWAGSVWRGFEHAAQQSLSLYVCAANLIRGFKRGSRVYLLDDPSNRTWVSARI
jgi:hypothetical protein